jgi:hypothetical protein
MSIDNLVESLIVETTEEEIKVAENWIKNPYTKGYPLPKNCDCKRLMNMSHSLFCYLLNISEHRECSSTVWKDFITSTCGRYYAAFHGYLESYRISDFKTQSLLIKAYKMLSIFQMLVIQSKRTRIQLRGSKGGLKKYENYNNNDSLRCINLIKELLPYLENCKNYDHILLVNYLFEKDYYYCKSNSIYSYNHPIEKYRKDCTGEKGRLNFGQCANGRNIRSSLKSVLNEIIEGYSLGEFNMVEDEIKNSGLKILKKHKVAARKVLESIEK